jgi:hypothetical protein
MYVNTLPFGIQLLYNFVIKFCHDNVADNVNDMLNHYTVMFFTILKIDHCLDVLNEIFAFPRQYIIIQ